jgi:peptide/nickel transport system substrate-binding protein
MMNLSKRAERALLLVLALIAALALASCGDNAEDTANDETDDVSAPEADADDQAAESDTDDEAVGGDAEADDAAQRVSLVMLLPPRSALSPFSDDAFKLSRWSMAETLVVLDDAGDVQPLLATDWTREDDTTWRFTIRDGVSFHNGAALDADAVATALSAGANADPVPRILRGVELGVEVDGSDVVLTTAVPDPLLPARLSSPQLSILAPDAYASDVVDPIGHGTGAFELVAVDGNSGATLDRFDGYWGDAAVLDGIDVSFVPDGTARAAAVRTQDPVIVEAIPPGQAPNIDEQLIYEVPMPRTNTLYLNTESGPLADPALRAAVREAVDGSAVADIAYEGRADVAEGLLGPALAWAAPLRDSDDYQEILSTRAEAGDADGVEITLATYSDRSELPEVAVIVQQQLEAAGFVVTQDVREYQFIEADALAGAFDAFILSRGTVLDSGDPVAYYEADFGCDGGFSISQLCDADVDARIAEASQTEAGEDRRAALLRAEAAILALDAAVPLVHERVIQGESASVVDAARDPRERRVVTTETRIDGAS